MLRPCSSSSQNLYLSVLQPLLGTLQLPPAQHPAFSTGSKVNNPPIVMNSQSPLDIPCINTKRPTTKRSIRIKFQFRNILFILISSGLYVTKVSHTIPKNGNNCYIRQLIFRETTFRYNCSYYCVS